MITPLVDAHVHCWDPRVLHYPWLAEEPVFDRPILPAEIGRSAQQTAMIFVQAAASPNQAIAEVEWVLDQHWPELAGIVADVRLGALDLSELLETYSRLPQVVGTRHILQDSPPGEVNTSTNSAGLAQLGEAGLVFDATVRADQLKELASLHARTAEVAVVLNHLGNPPVDAGFASRESRSWLEGIRSVAAQQTATVKLSGVPWDNRSRPFFEATLDAFGFERAMLGSDFPVTDPGERRWDEVADILAPTAESRSSLRWRTASRVYGLASPSERTHS